MNYRIIIAKDNKKKKILYEGKNLHNAQQKFFSIVDKNKVLFPKKHNAYKKNKPVKYEILLLKEKEEDDNTYFDRDELGRTIELTVKNNSWTILEKQTYEYEEKFSVYGFRKRLDTISIIKLILMKDIKKENIIKQINYVNNNVLIHHNEDFDVITCKCIDDAKRLHNLLRDFCKKSKIKNVIFSGKSTGRNKSKMYDLIIEKTGWKIEKLYRTTTRP